MPNVMLSIKEFVTQLHVGDIFWHMTSRHFSPYFIEGPCKITDFIIRGKQGFLNVKCTIQHGSIKRVEEYSVNDLTNEYHGVFLNEADAHAYLKKRRIAYKSDPALIAKANST